jgi:hypothetical protein
MTTTYGWNAFLVASFVSPFSWFEISYSLCTLSESEIYHSLAYKQFKYTNNTKSTCLFHGTFCYVVDWSKCYVTGLFHPDLFFSCLEGHVAQTEHYIVIFNIPGCYKSDMWFQNFGALLHSPFYKSKAVPSLIFCVYCNILTCVRELSVSDFDRLILTEVLRSFSQSFQDIAGRIP